MSITERIDAVTKISDLRVQMKGIQPAPKSVKIEIVGRCNLLCKYCAINTREHQPKKDMDFHLFQRITEDMRVCGVEEIGLFYIGESTLNPSLLIQAIEWTKRELQFPYVFLTSNATVCDADLAGKIMMAGLDSLKWSVNFANVNQFMKITRSHQNMFLQAVKNIKDAWLERKAGNYTTTLSASSILYADEQKDEMETFLNDSIRPYVDKHYWLPLYQMSMYKKHIEQILGYIPTAGNMGRIDESTMLPNRKPLPCWSAFTEGHVRVDGGLSACCFGSDDKFDMGLLDGTNFMRQWNSPKFQALREAQLNTLTEGQDALKDTPCRVCVAHEGGNGN